MRINSRSTGNASEVQLVQINYLPWRMFSLAIRLQDSNEIVRSYHQNVLMAWRQEIKKEQSPWMWERYRKHGYWLKEGNRNFSRNSWDMRLKKWRLARLELATKWWKKRRRLNSELKVNRKCSWAAGAGWHLLRMRFAFRSAIEQWQKNEKLENRIRGTLQSVNISRANEFQMNF